MSDLYVNTKRNYRRRRSLVTIAVFVLLIAVLLICQLCLKGGREDLGEDFSEVPENFPEELSESRGKDTAVASPSDLPWQLVLVNASHAVPDQTGLSLAFFEDGQMIDSRIEPALKKMFQDCRRAGLLPCATSAYRTAEQQERIFNAKVEEACGLGLSGEDAVTEALGWAARPGYSEHQTGLALDINSADEKKCPSSRVYTWLAEHGAEYGFILRYPEEKKEITGTQYEPWHFRYVGKTAAAEITSSGICLEEYLSGR